MKKNLGYKIVIAVLCVVSAISMIAANPNNQTLICFDASKPVYHYDGQGFHSKSFELVGRTGELVVETGKNPGLTICDNPSLKNVFSKWYTPGC